MTNDVVERVARAICAKMYTGEGPDDDRTWRDFDKVARVAIIAMRDPPNHVIAYIRKNADLVNYPITDTIDCLIDAALGAVPPRDELRMATDGAGDCCVEDGEQNPCRMEPT